jgi:hypothetical protein
MVGEMVEDDGGNNHGMVSHHKLVGLTPGIFSP